MMIDQISPLGVILAGGMSRRMDGNDKFLEVINGQTILNHIKTRLSPQVDKMVFNHNKPRDSEGLEVVSDIISNAGPLGGIHTALSYAKEKGIDRIVTVPCDTPFIPMDYVLRLRNVDKPLVIASSKNRLHPVLALWHVSLLETVEASLENGERKLMRLIENIDYSVVHWDGEPDPFFNINTPDDLSRAKEVVPQDL
ncbi:MAG: molybdenum cofactor guanylyltransferase MobA [Emcibacteraceae bacterium]|nr:molybdenum cofactor guanylyltransferase MobA [Emcibacteraceae bacterium]MDG1995910.1 molybdenum cofactor guanylyltransferase MobA [Emcibacteraceae bacterium]